MGLDAGMVAYSNEFQGVHADGSFTTKQLDWAYDADVWVRHSAIPDPKDIPVYMALHGRPESSLLLESDHSNPVVSVIAKKRYKGYITFWKEYLSVWSRMLSEVQYVPATVDLDYFKPVEKKDKTVLIADMWRDDVTPFNVIFAAADFCESSGYKLDIVGLPNRVVQPLKHFLRGMKCLGELAGQMKDIKSWYDRASMVVTPHVIATRIIRESLACGIEVVAGSGCQYTPFTGNPMDIPSMVRAMKACMESPSDPRGTAEREFNFKNAGLAMRSVLDV